MSYLIFRSTLLGPKWLLILLEVKYHLGSTYPHNMQYTRFKILIIESSKPQCLLALRLLSWIWVDPWCPRLGDLQTQQILRNLECGSGDLGQRRESKVPLPPATTSCEQSSLLQTIFSCLHGFQFHPASYNNNTHGSKASWVGSVGPPRKTVEIKNC